VAACLACAAPAHAVTLRVDAKSNIYGAGHSTLPGGNRAGVRPRSVRVSAARGRILTFSRVTGRVGCAGTLTNGPDGRCFTSTDITSLGGISGIVDRESTMFMVGLFLGNSEPRDPAPPRLDFSEAALGHDFAALSPRLDQVFFIGNGVTGTGLTQRFRVPSGATRLFLGFADAFAFHGSPGAYDDNVGSLNAIFTTSDAPDEPPPPVAGQSVVAQVTSGTVFVRVPAGKRIRRGGRGRRSAVVSQTRRFRRYRGKANIPVGSTIDTRRGRISIVSASNLRSGTQRGVFYDGIFQIKQARSSRPVTDAELVTSRRACSSDAGRSSQSRKRLGRLWANGKGRFRTKGRYSSATVRGTTWLTEERCDGTLTRVTKGTVAVRDRVARKTVLLTAGQSYFARAQTASSK
jgi:hypothetical protein